MRNIWELEGLKKEDMTEDEFKLKESVIDRIISIVLHKGYNDKQEDWSVNNTDRLLVYQEDIMMLCQYGGGFTLSRADDVRRAMSKKKMSLMESFKDEFVNGWQEKVGIFGEEIWEKMVDYAKYCFNKSHGVSYTLITMKTAELCLPDNINEFMLYNYAHANKPEKKAAAINHLLETSNLQFPTFRKPFDGLKIVSSKNVDAIEVKQVSAPDLDTDRTYSTFAELYMADLGPSLKFELICRGLYDSFCMDIMGLAQLNKAMGKKLCKYDELPKGAFPNENLDGVIKVLDMQGCFEYVADTPVRWELLPVKSPRAKKDPEVIYIYKSNNMGDWPANRTQYRMQQLKKQFSIIKKNGLSMYEDKIGQLRELADKVNSVLDKVREQNPGLKINGKNFQVVMKKVPALNDKFQSMKKAVESEVLTGFVMDKVLLKNGSCMFSFNFLNDYTPVKFYSKDPEVIRGIEKGAVVNFRLLVNDTIWRGNFKVFSNIGLA